MNEEFEALKTITGRLDQARLPYMVTGSMAMNYYAVPRMTRDIDLVIELAERDVPTLIELFEAEFYIDRESVREALRHHGMFNIIHNATLVKADFVIRKDTPYRQEEFRRRKRVSVDTHQFWIVAPEDLILSKLDWAKDSHSAFQLADVRNLLQSQPDLDRDYLGQWANRLGLASLLAEAAS